VLIAVVVLIIAFALAVLAIAWGLELDADVADERRTAPDATRNAERPEQRQAKSRSGVHHVA